MNNILNCQDEELEVLQSIYDGDDNFQKIDGKTFQYTYRKEGSPQTFLLELQWVEGYPDKAPTINLDLFCNKFLSDSAKDAIKISVGNQISELLGTPMTFSLFEWAKDNIDHLLEDITPFSKEQPSIAPSSPEVTMVSARKDRKERLSKQQKRRLLDKFGVNTEDRQRGWNWVDVIKHLSQTGGRANDSC